MSRNTDLGMMAIAASALFLSPAASIFAAVQSEPSPSDALAPPAAVFNNGAANCAPFSNGCKPYNGGALGTEQYDPNGMNDGTSADSNFNSFRTSPFAQSPAGSQALEQAVAPGAYLDMAMPITQIRVRYDAAWGNNFPDRGEYFYAKCGAFRGVAAQNIGGKNLQDPSARGPNKAESNVDYQDVRTYLEYAVAPQGSVFVELPFRAVNPEQNNNRSGFADMNLGFKYAMLAEQDQYLTAQTRVYLPTGDPRDALGTGHTSIEVGLLYFKMLDERFTVQAEVKDWIPVNGNRGYSSNVIEAGTGLGYIAHDDGQFVVVPVVEIVGWTFIDGQKSSLKLASAGDLPKTADGDTIVNVKPGIRFGWKNPGDPVGFQRNSLYLGWAHPISNDRFYQNMVRLEYRVVY